MPRKIALTDRFIKAMKPAPPGQRIRVWDAVSPGMCVRVNDQGARSFMVYKAWKGKPSPYVGSLGKYPDISLEQARKKVPAILQALAEGKNPRELEAEEIREAARKRADTVSTAIEAFIAWEADESLRSAHATAVVLRREFLGMEAKRQRKAQKWETVWSEGKEPIWRNRPVSTITRRDIIARLDEIRAERGKFALRHGLIAIRKFFSWLEAGERYGVVESPARGISDKTFRIGGQDLKRQRVLTDPELVDVWKAAETLAYPAGSVIQLLMLTGQRLSDITDAKWSEIDLTNQTLMVPPERYKTGVAHLVPLPRKAVEILSELSRFTGEYVFTTTAGKKPLGSLSKAKTKLDLAIAARRKTDGRSKMPPWKIHDLRRTVRTRLSDLGVDSFIAERVIGHALPGLHAVYDRSSHAEQKRDALDRWARLLLSIVEPPPSTPSAANVVPMKRAKR